MQGLTAATIIIFFVKDEDQGGGKKENSMTLSDAGRNLFSVSRDQKKNRNDADRPRKYLGRFSLEWQDL